MHRDPGAIQSGGPGTCKVSNHLSLWAMEAVERARLAALARQALGKAGATPGRALATAEALVSAQADGKDAHGLARLESVVASLESGEADGRTFFFKTSAYPCFLDGSTPTNPRDYKI